MPLKMGHWAYMFDVEYEGGIALHSGVGVGSWPEPMLLEVLAPA